MPKPWRYKSLLAPLAMAATLSIILPSIGKVAGAETVGYFTRGDVDGDRRFLMSDAIGIFRYLFLSDPDAGVCEDAADTDDDGAVTITDGIYLLNYLFQGGSPPPPPFPNCGDDTTEDALWCEPRPTCPQRVSFTFFRQEFLADTVIFVVDHSGSMNDRGELQLAKKWLAESFSTLSSHLRFGVVYFDYNIKKFPSDGHAVAATPAMIAAARSFDNAIGRGHGTCPIKALREALQFVLRENSRNNVIIYISDGGGTCGGEGGGETGYLKMMVAQITAQNFMSVQIHCYGIMMTGRATQEMYLKQLAAANNGEYYHIYESN